MSQASNRAKLTIGGGDSSHSVRILNRRAVLNALGAGIYVTRLGAGIVKIGWSATLGRRVNELGSYDNLLALVPGATLDDERDLHERLRGHAVIGRERYLEADPVVVSLINELREPMGLSPITV